MRVGTKTSAYKSKKASKLNELYAAARNDLAVFAALVYRTDKGKPVSAEAGSWHEELVDLLMAIEAGVITPRASKILDLPIGASFKRLNNNCPFGIGKSTWTSVIFPAWYLGRNPGARIGIISNSADNAKLFSDAVRSILLRPAYKAIFPDVKPAPKDRGKKWTAAAWNLARVGADAASPSFSAFGWLAEITSRRFDMLIIDDAADEEVAPTKYMREKFSKRVRENAFSRVTDNGRILNIGTIRHLEDWHCELAKDPDWITIRRPALYADDMRRATEEREQETVEEMLARCADLKSICPSVFSVAGELTRRNDLTPPIYEVSCQQNEGYLKRTEGKYIQRPLLKYDAKLPPRDAMIGIAIDCAMTSKDERDNADLQKIAYTVIVEGWRSSNNHLHVFGLERDRIGSLKQIELVNSKIEYHRNRGHEVVIGFERAAGGKQLQELLEKKWENDDGVHFDDNLTPITDKVERSEPLRREMSDGRVHLSGAFRQHEDEIVRFPDGYCDIVDASSWLARIEIEQADGDESDPVEDEEIFLDEAERIAASRASRDHRTRDSFTSDREAEEFGNAFGKAVGF